MLYHQVMFGFACPLAHVLEAWDEAALWNIVRAHTHDAAETARSTCYRKTIWWLPGVSVNYAENCL